MSGSLLTFLAPRMKIPLEDIATRSLCHIISQPHAAFLKQAFTDLLCSCLNTNNDGVTIFYDAQVIGEEKDRPDIVGYDEKGNEVLICEAKFYAALTENQPNTYLKRLKEKNGKGLIFLCPQNRVIGLWNQVKAIPSNAKPEADRCVSIDGILMGIVSWKEVLDKLKEASSRNGDEMMADLLELEGFCQDQSRRAFAPFKLEDCNADVAVSIDRYYIVLDQTKDLLLSQKDYGIHQGEGRSKLQSRTKWDGYSVYMTSPLCSVSLFFDRDAWQQPNSVITPFWLGFDNGNWDQGGLLAAYLNTIPTEKKQRNRKDGIIMFALNPPIGLTLEESAHYLCKQVLEYMDDYKKFCDANK